MTNMTTKYGSPNMGCLVGTAYQAMVAQLASALCAEKLDISVPEYMVLRMLYFQEGLQQCELATALGKDKAAVCRCVKGMQTKGLVRTETVSHKCLRVFLTDEGRNLKPAVMKVAEERHKALTSLLSEEQLSMFVDALKKIINN